MTTVLTEREPAEREPAEREPAEREPHAPVERVVTVLTARVVEVEGLLARVAAQLNPYDVRELALCLDTGTLRVVVAGNGFHAERVAARLAKIIGILDITAP